MTVDIAQADVLEWAKTYNGPQFHALLCDPPYHLSDSRDPRRASPDPAQRPRREKAAGFMGKAWDGGDIAFRPDTWAALAAHLLPGAFIMAFSGARTYHRMACAIEDAGLILHSMIGWVYGSGFPKATRIDTQVDKAAGAEQIPTGQYKRASIQRNGEGENWARGAFGSHPEETKHIEIMSPATPLASAWAGHRYGLQAMKPALEPICVAQVPYRGKPVDCITQTGAGALWIEGGRLEGPAWKRPTTQDIRGGGYGSSQGKNDKAPRESAGGRWPANLALCHTPECRLVGTRRVRGTPGHDDIRDTPARSWKNTSTAGIRRANHADADGLETVERWECAPGCPVQALDAQAGGSVSSNRPRHNTAEAHNRTQSMGKSAGDWITGGYSDSGGPSRFFFVAQADAIEDANPFYYCAKASRAERDRGLEGMPAIRRDTLTGDTRPSRADGERRNEHTPAQPCHNPHPTVKPVALARWLATLLLPPSEYAPRRIMIPFAGSGSECIAAALAGWEEVVGIEREAEYVEIARARIREWTVQPMLLAVQA